MVKTGKPVRLGRERVKSFASFVNQQGCFLQKEKGFLTSERLKIKQSLIILEERFLTDILNTCVRMNGGAGWLIAYLQAMSPG